MRHRSIRRTLLAAIAAMAALALSASSAAADWEIQDQNGNPYTGPLDFRLLPGTWATFEGQYPNWFKCNQSLGSLDVTDSGATSGTPAGELETLEFTYNGSQTCHSFNFMIAWNPDSIDPSWSVTIEDDPDGSGAALVIDDPELVIPWTYVPQYPDEAVYGADEIVGSLVASDVVHFTAQPLNLQEYVGSFTNLDFAGSYKLRTATGAPVSVVSTN